MQYNKANQAGRGFTLFDVLTCLARRLFECYV